MSAAAPPATGVDLARAARDFVGIPFRLHGRSRSAGLDCLGLLHAALEHLHRTPALPEGYALRTRRPPDPDRLATANDLVPVQGPLAAGDVLLVRTAPCQLHLAIATGRDRIVHAHAGLRRVVEGPLPADWPILRHWRLACEGT